MKISPQFQFRLSTTNHYRCHRSPWLVCPVWACSQSEGWLPPSPYATHSAASQSMWSCTSAIKDCVCTLKHCTSFKSTQKRSNGALISRTWTELAGLGAIFHSSWLPGTTSTVSAGGEGTSSWSSAQPWTAWQTQIMLNRQMSSSQDASLQNVLNMNTNDLVACHFYHWMILLMQKSQQ